MKSVVSGLNNLIHSTCIFYFKNVGIPLKKIIVTGSGGGIGKAICHNLIKVGYGVIAIDVSEKSMTSLKENRNGETNILDLSDYEAVQDYFKLFKRSQTLLP